MQQIINFILRFRTFLIYLLLLFIALALTIQSHSYHKSKFLNSANFLSGGFYNMSHGVSGYFNLKAENEILQEENRRLNMLLFNSKNSEQSNAYIDSTAFNTKYKFYTAQVIKNSYTLSDNYITINVGEKDSIKQDLGVITSKGILGIINNTSNGYSNVLSILNTNSRISAQIKNSNHFGSLHWDTVSPEFIQLTEIPRKAKISIGDTIITSGRSSIFPKGIPIGIVNYFKLNTINDFFEVDVKLFNDMTSIEHVYIIKNLDLPEIQSLDE